MLAIEIDTDTGMAFMNIDIEPAPETLKFPINLSAKNKAVIQGKGRHMGESIQVLAKYE